MLRKQPLSDYHADLAQEFTRPPSIETLRRRCKAGKIPAVQDETGHWFVLVKPKKPYRPRKAVVEHIDHVIKGMQKYRPSGRVYLARGAGRFKIGWTRSDPAKRIRELSASSPVPVELLAHIPGDHQHERILHSIFSHRRLSGEWFEQHPDIAWAFARMREALQTDD